MTLTSSLDRLREAARPKQWTPPEPGSLNLITVDSIQSLGEIRDRAWWTHDRLGELREERALLSDRDALSGILVTTWMAGERRYRQFTAHAPGTFAQLASRQAPVDRPKVERPTDILTYTALSRHSASRPSFRIRGAQAIVEFLTTKGVRVVASTDGTSLVILAQDGRYSAPFVEAAERATPLLLPFLRDGQAPLCNVSRHDVEAQTVAAGGTAWCGECLP